MKAQIEERKANTLRGRAKREALVAAMELKDYEFNAHGVDLGQFYESATIVPDASERPQHGDHRPRPRDHRHLPRLGADPPRTTKTARSSSAPTSTSASAR